MLHYMYIVARLNARLNTEVDGHTDSMLDAFGDFGVFEINDTRTKLLNEHF